MTRSSLKHLSQDIFADPSVQALSDSLLDDKRHCIWTPDLRETIDRIVNTDVAQTPLLANIQALAHHKDYQALLEQALYQQPKPNYQNLKLLMALGANPAAIDTNTKRSFLEAAALKNDCFAARILAHNIYQNVECERTAKDCLVKALQRFLEQGNYQGVFELKHALPLSGKDEIQHATYTVISGLVSHNKFKQASALTQYAHTNLGVEAFPFLMASQLTSKSIGRGLELLAWTDCNRTHDSLLCILMRHVEQTQLKLDIPLESLYYAMRTLFGRIHAIQCTSTPSQLTDLEKELSAANTTCLSVHEKDAAYMQLANARLQMGDQRKALQLNALIIDSDARKSHRDLLLRAT